MLKKLIVEKTTGINIRITKSELALIKDQANKFTNGNVSAWLRYSALNYKPSKSEIGRE